MKTPLLAGACALSITPATSQFLDGYPHGKRFSTGVDTDLFVSALYLERDSEKVLILGMDLLFVEKPLGRRIREGITLKTGLEPGRILLAVTHTHSAPVTRDNYPFNREKPERKADNEYLERVVEQSVRAGVSAIRSSVPSEVGIGCASCAEIGGNRRDPAGPSNPEVPVVFVRTLEDHSPLALLLTVAMHPTVLHEDSFLVSGDFPGHCRLRLQESLGLLPVIHLTGAAGNQSPRHKTRSNTVDEARRLGRLLAGSVLGALECLEFDPDLRLGFDRCEVDLPFNNFPSVEKALSREKMARAHFDALQNNGGDPKATRTAEVDWFGTERLLLLARLAASGELVLAAKSACLPAEVQLLAIGDWIFAAWPGEAFVEFALELMKERPQICLITYANSALQGYLVTREAVEEGGYEASGAVFKSPESPEILLKATRELIASLDASRMRGI